MNDDDERFQSQATWGGRETNGDAWRRRRVADTQRHLVRVAGRGERAAQRGYAAESLAASRVLSTDPFAAMRSLDTTKQQFHNFK